MADDQDRSKPLSIEEIKAQSKTKKKPVLNNPPMFPTVVKARSSDYHSRDDDDAFDSDDRIPNASVIGAKISRTRTPR